MIYTIWKHFNDKYAIEDFFDCVDSIKRDHRYNVIYTL